MFWDPGDMERMQTQEGERALLFRQEGRKEVAKNRRKVVRL